MELPRSEHLESFAVFAELRNFTHAARRLGLSQPALHVQIRRLSEALGVALYRRRGRELELTDAGLATLAFARESHRRSVDLVARLRGREARARVRLAAGEGAYLYLLGPAIRAFSARPKTELTLLVRDRDGALDAVRSGDAELGVATDGVRPDDLAFEPLTTVGPVVVLPRDHRLARKRALDPTDLAGERLIAPPLGRPLRTALAGALAAAGVDVEIALEATGWELLVCFARLRAGLAVVNAFVRVPAPLVARPLRGLPPVRYGMVSRADAAPSEATRKLAELLKKHADDWR